VWLNLNKTYLTNSRINPAVAVISACRQGASLIVCKAIHFYHITTGFFNVIMKKTLPFGITKPERQYVVALVGII
jgi:hypothetical protein